MKKAFLSLVLVPAVLVGCASSDHKYMPQTSTESNQPAGKILVFRTSSLQASLAKAYVGFEEGYFSKLDENQYLQFEIDPGFHTFKARAHGSIASESEIKVMPGEMLCIEARPNYEELEWLAIPFINALIPSFVLKETTCPSPDALSKLTAI